MNTTKLVKRKPKAIASVPRVIRCIPSELVSVLAALRRRGCTTSEPVRDGPTHWLVFPGGGNGGLKHDPYGDDKAYSFHSFTQGMRGTMALHY